MTAGRVSSAVGCFATTGASPFGSKHFPKFPVIWLGSPPNPFHCWRSEPSQVCRSIRAPFTVLLCGRSKHSFVRYRICPTRAPFGAGALTVGASIHPWSVPPTHLLSATTVPSTPPFVAVRMDCAGRAEVEVLLFLAFGAFPPTPLKRLTLCLGSSARLNYPQRGFYPKRARVHCHN